MRNRLTCVVSLVSLVSHITGQVSDPCLFEPFLTGHCVALGPGRPPCRAIGVHAIGSRERSERVSALGARIFRDFHRTVHGVQQSGRSGHSRAMHGPVAPLAQLCSWANWPVAFALVSSSWASWASWAMHRPDWPGAVVVARLCG
ncbi:hypothetical protein NFA_2530 [Nocardia farcinica IFM 10152]|uniref:Uncharacterized protein n=1 Tax=Nocardia farcinica (strain IFM 10152) TaxID=247156 RepID=Q5Z396_NOCFA|nr:hypothetical protein NFA_2530 [Nocardia farcinica IFM 10152]